MKRSMIWLSVSLLVLLAGGFTLIAGGNRAVVVKDMVCYLLDGNGNPANEAGVGQQVTTPNGINFVCKGNVTPSNGGTAVQFDSTNTDLPGCCVQLSGTSCAVFTQNWQETVSADGQASLTCHN